MPGTPSEWAERLRVFRDRFAEHRGEITGVAVHWRASPRRSGRSAPLLFLNAPKLGYLISVWPIDAPLGTRATLIFEIGPHPALADEGDGVLYGEFDLNGALCLEVATNEVLWPTYNPRPPAFRAQRR